MRNARVSLSVGVWTVLALVGWCASIAPAQSFRQDVDLRALSLSTKSFDELKHEYLRLVESLQRDAQRFRDSLPVYQDFLDTLVNVALPLQVRCELARLKAVTYYAPLSGEERRNHRLTDKQAKERDKIHRSLLWSVCGENVRQAREATPLGSSEHAVLTSLIDRHRGVKVMDDPLSYENPFPAGTVEHAVFLTNLGEPLSMTLGLISDVLRATYPRSLLEREEFVYYVYDVMAAQARAEGAFGVPPPRYEDEYTRTILLVREELAQVTRAFWEAKKLGNRSDDEILDELALATAW